MAVQRDIRGVRGRPTGGGQKIEFTVAPFRDFTPQPLPPLPPLAADAIRSKAVKSGQKQARRRRGRQSTMLTSALGLGDPASIQRKTLLGQ